MGVDGISVLFVLLATALTPICIVASWESIHSRIREYMIAFLVLETMMVGMFCASDFILFYVFFEGVLIPMYIIIGVWGGPRRVYASFKSSSTRCRLGADDAGRCWRCGYYAGTTDLVVLTHTAFPATMQFWLFSPSWRRSR